MTELAAISALMQPASSSADAASVSSMLTTNYGKSSEAGSNFVDFLGETYRTADQKLEDADQIIQKFAVDDSIPLHQVTIALEEARLSVELMMQVRARVLESYRDFMNMQV